MIHELLEGMNAYGSDNAISKEYLEKVTCLSNRKVRELIENERRAGYLICSQMKDGGGYFIATDEFEIRRYIHEQRARANSILLALEPFKRAINYK